MIEIVLSSSFRNAYKRKIRGNKKLEKRFREKMEIFRIDAFDARLRTHKLSGQLEGLWSFSIEYDLRIVFSFVTRERALFVDIGTHDEVY